ncbi:Alkyltransferase-like protein 1 [Malassezia sp. CBS 17886]|nr:Alkyltransferase-like protein 1 [Malassezia sp. CBS 17886]
MRKEFHAEEFHSVVYDVVRLIPRGRVTAYGHIATLAGYPGYHRMVGAALKYLQTDSVPWQRVVAADGTIPERGDGGKAAGRQANLLRDEGVAIVESSLPSGGRVSTRGRWRVQSMAVDKGWGWYLQGVPNEVAGKGTGL